MGHNVGGLEAEDLLDGLDDFIVINLIGAKGVNIDADGIGVADGVCELELALGRQSGCHDILGNPTSHVCR